MKRKTLVLISILPLFLLLIPMRVFSAGRYVASIHSDVFHDPDCSYVNRISEGNKIWFDTVEEAVASGRRGCSRCNPTYGDYQPSGTRTGSSGSAGTYSSGYVAGKEDGYGEGYADGEAAGYASGEKAGYNSGYSDGKAEMEAVVESEKKRASRGAYLLSFLIGAPAVFIATCAFAGKMRDKQERDLRDKIKKLEGELSEYRKSPAGKPGKASPPPKGSGVESASVNSSCIKFVEFYDDAIYVTFNDGRKFCYYNTPRSVYQGLITAASKGTYFYQNIEGKYPSVPF